MPKKTRPSRPAAPSPTSASSEPRAVAEAFACELETVAGRFAACAAGDFRAAFDESGWQGVTHYNRPDGDAVRDAAEVQLRCLAGDPLRRAVMAGLTLGNDDLDALARREDLDRTPWRLVCEILDAIGWPPAPLDARLRFASEGSACEDLARRLREANTLPTAPAMSAPAAAILALLVASPTAMRITDIAGTGEDVPGDRRTVKKYLDELKGLGLAVNGGAGWAPTAAGKARVH